MAVASRLVSRLKATFEDLAPSAPPMVAQAALMFALGVGMTHADTRYAVRYAPGVFEMVARNRGMAVERCMVASPVHPLGAWLLVEGREGRRLRCKVVDVSAPRDRARHIKRRIIEVDPASGAVLCGKQWKGRAVECPVKVKP